MTKVFYTKHSNKAFTIEVKGHAGYAELGNDIVCSAISMLIQTLIAHMDEVADDYEARVDSGDVWLWAAGQGATDSAETIMTGFRLLEISYPEYINVDRGVPYT